MEKESVAAAAAAAPTFAAITEGGADGKRKRAPFKRDEYETPVPKVQRLDEPKDKAIIRGVAFVKSLMENLYEPIPESNGMSVLRNVVMLDSGKLRDVVLRSTTISF